MPPISCGDPPWPATRATRKAHRDAEPRILGTTPEPAKPGNGGGLSRLQDKKGPLRSRSPAGWLRKEPSRCHRTVPDRIADPVTAHWQHSDKPTEPRRFARSTGFLLAGWNVQKSLAHHHCWNANLECGGLVSLVGSLAGRSATTPSDSRTSALERALLCCGGLPTAHSQRDRARMEDAATVERPL